MIMAGQIGDEYSNEW